MGLIKLMSVVSLVIAPALHVAKRQDWFPAVGAGILVLVLIVLYFVQKSIDAWYAANNAELKEEEDKILAERAAEAKAAEEAEEDNEGDDKTEGAEEVNSEGVELTEKK